MKTLEVRGEELRVREQKLRLDYSLRQENDSQSLTVQHTFPYPNSSLTSALLHVVLPPTTSH